MDLSELSAILDAGRPESWWELPTELLEIIANNLDCKSHYALQSTCRRFRHALCLRYWDILELNLIFDRQSKEEANTQVANTVIQLPSSDGTQTTLMSLDDVAEHDDIAPSRTMFYRPEGAKRRISIGCKDIFTFQYLLAEGFLSDLLMRVKTLHLTASLDVPWTMGFSEDWILNPANGPLSGYLVKALSKLQNVELEIEIPSSSLNREHHPNLLHYIQTAFPSCEINVLLWGKCPHLRQLAPLTRMNLKLLTCDFNYVKDAFFEDSPRFASRLVRFVHHMRNLERFDLNTRNPGQVSTTALRKLPKTLKSLTLCPIDIINPGRIRNFLPESLEDLAIFDRGLTDSLGSLNIKYLMVDSLSGIFFKRTRFPALERLYISFYEGMGAPDVCRLPIRQLRCNNILPVKLQDLINPESVESLILDDIDTSFEHLDPRRNQLDRLTASLCKYNKLRFIMLNTNWLFDTEFSLSDLIALKSMVKKNNGQFFIQHPVTAYPDEWLHEVHGTIEDHISVLRPMAGFKVFEIDLDHPALVASVV